MNEAALIVWRKRIALLRALAGSGIAIAILEASLHHFMLEHPSWLLIVALSIVNAVLTTWFAVTCHRIVLLEDGATPKYGVHCWSQREMRFFGWTIVGFLCLLASVVIAAVPAAIISKGRDPFNDYPMLWYLVAIPGAYLSARLSLLLPATAIGKQLNIKWAWETTSGNGWRLLSVVCFLPFVFEMATEYSEISDRVILRFIGCVIGLALLALAIAALSVSYRFLTDTTNDEDPTYVLPSIVV